MSSYTVGLDLGQGQDFSALVVVERVLMLPEGATLSDHARRPEFVGPLTGQWHVRHLRRWELGTPYPVVVTETVQLMRTEAMREALLVIDGTGVGRAVRDMFRDEYRRARFGCNWPYAVTITGGQRRHGPNIPKADLFAAVQVPLQQGRLKIAHGLALGEVLADELVQFRRRITDAGRELLDFERRPGQGHGDLVNALALAMVQPNTSRRPDVIENPQPLEETHDRYDR